MIVSHFQLNLKSNLKKPVFCGTTVFAVHAPVYIFYAIDVILSNSFDIS